ncbi:hypothetical protein SK128_000200 [Halocaridina rubra]|uniref:Uncharacterized protein n=1 Tax=Halocaridina rubra TaxID=373956 RepID=A0AAN8ZTS4_HALRR
MKILIIAAAVLTYCSATTESIHGNFSTLMLEQHKVVHNREITLANLTQTLLNETSNYNRNSHELFSENLLKGVAKRSLRNPLKISEVIVLSARLALEQMDAFKEGFAMALVRKTWEKANFDYSRHYFRDAYLPIIPSQIPYTPRNISFELIRTYAMMQHAKVSLEILILDQILKNSVNSYFNEVNEVASKTIHILDELKFFMNAEHCLPNGQEIKSLTSLLYLQVSRSTRRNRDFVILRDVYDAYQNLKDTFRNF